MLIPLASIVGYTIVARLSTRCGSQFFTAGPEPGRPARARRPRAAASARDRRHARDGRHRDAALGAARHRDRGLPQRDRRPARAAGADDRRRDERDPVDRRRSVHLRRVHPRRCTSSRPGFAAALALAVLMLPTVTRTAEVVLRLVPGGLREASLALGGGEWRNDAARRAADRARRPRHRGDPRRRARRRRDRAAAPHGARQHVVQRQPVPRQAGRAAAVRLPARPLPADRRRSQRAWTGALVLLGLVLVLFVIARIIGGRGPGHIGRIKPLPPRTERVSHDARRTRSNSSTRRRRRRADAAGGRRSMRARRERVVRRPQGARPRVARDAGRTRSPR